MNQDNQTFTGGGGADFLDTTDVKKLQQIIQDQQLQIKKLANGGFIGAKLRNQIAELPQELTDQEEISDGYQLKFIGKNYAKFIADYQETETIITPDAAHNSKPENANSENIFITGDNLDALRHLAKAYAGKIDMIYIDPPYNTGNDGFVYNDTFNFKDKDLQEKLGITESEVSKIRDLQGKSSHSAWLTFMYPRLKIAKQLLSENGVIFVSIDDNEQANLNILMSEIFGRSNFIANMPRKTRSSATTKSDAEIQKLNDYIIAFSKRENTPLNLKITGQKKYPLSDHRGDFYIVPLQDNGPNGTREARPNLYYPIYASKDNSVFSMEDFSGAIKILPKQHRRKDGCWMWSPKKFENDWKDLYHKNDRVFIKHYHNPEEDQNKYQREKNWLNENFLNAQGTKRLTDLGLQGMFSNPKPVELEKLLLTLASQKNSTILDFFAGSATTADAVIQLNAEDGGNRKYILVQLPEQTNPQSEARKAGFETIDQISRERIIRAANKIGDTSGFQHFRLTSPDNNDDITKLEEFDPNASVMFAQDHTDIFEGGEEAILRTWLTEDGYELTTKPEAVKFSDYKSYKMEENLYLISTSWTTDNTEELAKLLNSNKLKISTLTIFPYSFTFNELNELKVAIKGLVNLRERY